MNNAAMLGSLILSAGLLLGTTGCGNNAPAADGATAAAAAEETPRDPAGVVQAIEGFFAETTTDEIAAAFPDDADEKTFSAAVRYTDPAAGSEDVAAAMADFALLKVLDPKAQFSITVDESKVSLGDRTATVPVEAISVKSGDTIVANSAALAEEANDLVFHDGAWLIAFPTTSETAEASASPASSPSASAGSTK
ncbi:hypothetical protein [Arthrobacter zhaoxinii]|uniref:hypothetical protein n=1 Tax=Arthrobacter zhaoxinii TaxID=2964616 RepID=UPI002107E977|nr:hypothetical protein [Arthrobacter zhaoxinii]MCQ1999927.1 hypothetical protein [Arthrobacter zhaoxinii]